MKSKCSIDKEQTFTIATTHPVTEKWIK